jgi:uncharacterized protein YfaT (DUF1175 family)
MRRASITILVLALTFSSAAAQVRLTDASDRAALRAWFVLLADAQFYRPTADVIDCAALVRHALREAFRPHTPEWLRQAELPTTQVHADVRVKPPLVQGGGLGLFRVSAGEPASYAEFADAKTVIGLNARSLGRDLAALRPGDLLYFHQPSQKSPDHLMVFVGRSSFERDGEDWLVYHTGASYAGADAPGGDTPGEVRKVRLTDLLKHPAPRWRPIPGNPNFVGVFRLNLL